MQSKFILAIIAFFAIICVATATITQADLITAEELTILMEQVEAGMFDEAELALIAEALTEQETFLVQNTSTSFSQKFRDFVNNSYVQYTALGLAAAIAVAALAGLIAFAVKRYRTSKKEKQAEAPTEEGQGLLQPYDAVV